MSNLPRRSRSPSNLATVPEAARATRSSPARLSAAPAGATSASPANTRIVTSGRLAESALSPGHTTTISGAGFGGAPGQVQFSGPDGLVSASVTSWTDSLISLNVPAVATTGPVMLLTSSGYPVVVGRATILAQANGVASIHATQTDSALNTLPTTIVARAVDAANRPVSHAAVGLSDGVTVVVVPSDSSGLATFTVTGMGTRTYVAYSGAASLNCQSAGRRRPRCP